MNLTLPDLGRPGDSLAEVVGGFAAALRADIEQIADDTSTRIHDIRVGTKKIGALLRLAGPVVSASERAALRDLLRGIRGCFSGSRDEDVMRHRVESLFPGEGDAAGAELGLAAPGASPLPGLEEPGALAAALENRLAAVDFPLVTLSVLAQSATKSYRQARRLLHECREHRGDDALMHEWRKRTKEVCYHAMALSGVKSLRKRINALDALAESLGEYHDLAVLGERAADHDRIAAAVNQRKRELRRECLASGKKIFQRKPRRFRKNLTVRISAL